MKKLLLLLLFPLALFSCGKVKVYGKYAFQMGGDKSTHFGVFLNLTKDKYEDPITGEIGEKFEFGMKMSEDIVPEMPSTEDPNFLEKMFVYLFVDLMNVEGNPDAGMEGIYTVGQEYVEDHGKRLYLFEGILELLLTAYVDNTQVQLIIPVSLEDFQYQLCWYGLFVDFYYYTYEEEGKEKQGIGHAEYNLLEDKDKKLHGKIPGPQNWEDRTGTHPTASQVEEMNTVCKEIFHQTVQPDPQHPDIYVELNYEFRDSNALIIDLLRK